MSEDVNLTDDVMYGDNRGLAVFFGAVTGGLILTINTDNSQSFGEFVQKRELDIRKIVRDNFAAELKRQNILPLSETKGDGVRR